MAVSSAKKKVGKRRKTRRKGKKEEGGEEEKVEGQQYFDGKKKGKQKKKKRKYGALRKKIHCFDFAHFPACRSRSGLSSSYKNLLVYTSISICNTSQSVSLARRIVRKNS